MTDYYKVLQVDTEAELDVIQAAYRRLARKFHPDRSSGPEAVIRMVEINAAWEVLRDATRRASHDRALGIARPEAPSQARPIRYRPAPASVDRTMQDERLRHEADPRTRSDGPAESRPDRARAGGSPSRTVPDGEGGGGDRRPVWAPEGQDAGGRSRAWTSVRSTTGSTYDPATMHAPDGLGAAGDPPGHPSGSVMTFGRYTGWSLGEIGRVDSAYLEWLERMPVGRMYRDEIDALMRRMGRRRADDVTHERKGLFGR